MALATALGGSAEAQGDERFLLQGLTDVEGFKTDDGSRLLSRRDGHAALGLRLRLWTAVRLGAGFSLVASGESEGGTASEEGAYQALEQGFLRWTGGRRAPVIVDAGKVSLPIGNFSQRYLSSVNPLIGTPDAYDVTYPVGVVVTARVARVDLRGAIVDKPLGNEKYVPAADSAMRPALEAGVTPIIGLRAAVYATRGPYLGDGVSPFLPPGTSWHDYLQEVEGAELALSRGYFELNADSAWSRYDVPSKAERSRGIAWYVEPKYTWTPRFFTALRLERNAYPYIAPVAPSAWIAADAAFYDLEIGGGWRVTPGLLVKASYRRDRWDVPESRKPSFPDGYAVAAQLSWVFDVRRWFDRQR